MVPCRFLQVYRLTTEQKQQEQEQQQQQQQQPRWRQWHRQPKTRTYSLLYYFFGANEFNDRQVDRGRDWVHCQASCFCWFLDLDVQLQMGLGVWSCFDVICMLLFLFSNGGCPVPPNKTFFFREIIGCFGGTLQQKRGFELSGLTGRERWTDSAARCCSYASSEWVCFWGEPSKHIWRFVVSSRIWLRWLFYFVP